MAKKVQRNTDGLREALFDEWDSLRAGNSNPANSRAVASLAKTILASAVVDIQYNKLIEGQSGGTKAKRKIPPTPLTRK